MKLFNDKLYIVHRCTMLKFNSVYVFLSLVFIAGIDYETMEKLINLWLLHTYILL